MEWVLRQLGVNKILTGVLNQFGLRSLVEAIISRLGFTDMIGTFINVGFSTYMSKGREALIRAVTIKETSLEQWAANFRKGDKNAPGEVKEAFGKLSIAVANAVESLIPKNK